MCVAERKVGRNGGKEKGREEEIYSEAGTSAMIDRDFGVVLLRLSDRTDQRAIREMRVGAFEAMLFVSKDLCRIQCSCPHRRKCSENHPHKRRHSDAHRCR